MKTTIRVFLAIFALLVCSISAQAQRQTKLYIDDGFGNFLTLSAPAGGGAVTMPSSGTLVTSASGTAAAAGVLSPGANINGALFTGGSDITITAAPSGLAGGDLTGSSYPNPVISSGAVTGAKIALGTITALNLASGASLQNIGLGGISGSYIALGTIGGGNIASSTITGLNIASGTVTGLNLASGASLQNIGLGGISGSYIALGTIEGGNIASSTITGLNIASGTVTGLNLASGASLQNIGLGGISGSYIALGTIGGGNIASSTVTGLNIASGTITGLNLASGASLNNIGFGNITGSYLASATITGLQIASSTVAASNLQDDGTTGNVLTSNGGTPHWVAGTGVNLQAGTPGTQQTGNINVSGTVITGTALQTDNINPNATSGTTFGGAVSLASNNLLNVWQLTSHATSAPTGSGSADITSVTLAAHSTDMAGEVTFTATSATTGDAAKVSFAGSSYLSYNTTIVVLTPADAATALAFAGVGYYVNPSTSFFQIVLAAPVADGTYSFYYHVIAE